MGLSNYTELKLEIQNMVNRSDSPDQVEVAIKLAESFLSRELRTRELSVRSNITLTANNNLASLPSNFREAKSLYITGNPIVKLDLVSQEIIDERQMSDYNAKPKYFAYEGSDIRLAPTPDSDYTLSILYYKSIDNLSNVNPTNSILIKYPDLYLYSSLFEFSVFLKDIKAAAEYRVVRDRILAEVKRESRNADMSGSTIKSRSYYNAG